MADYENFIYIFVFGLYWLLYKLFVKKLTK